MEKKMASNSREISCPLARVGFFFENCFLLIPTMLATSRKIAVIKKYCLLLAEYGIC